MSIRNRTTVVAFVTFAALAFACGPGDEEASSPAAAAAPPSTAVDAAKAQFWTAFHAGDVERLPDAQRALAAAREGSKDPMLARFLGMSYLWSIRENGRKVRPLDDDGVRAAGGEALKQLQDLVALAPDEPRSFGFLSAGLVAFGMKGSDRATLEQGLAMLDQRALPGDPTDASLALGFVLADAPAGTPEFARGVDLLFDGLGLCLGETLDRDKPSFDGWNARRSDMRPRDVCFDGEHWPHTEEGTFLGFGDVLVKAGKVDAARRAYRAAKTVPSFATWKFNDLVDARLASDLDARAASYRDSSTAPPIGAAANACTQCHMK